MSDIGRHTYGEQIGVIKSAGAEAALAKIGAFCSVAPGVRILLGGEHHVDWVTTFPFHGEWGPAKEVAWGRGDVEIGNDVWLGLETLILSGSKIGDGAVIAARTVVSGTVAPYSIVGGNPMRLLRWRFPEPVRAALLEIKWWDWPDKRVRDALPYLLSPDIEKFISLVKDGII